MFLAEYLPNSLIKLFSKYDWIFDWKMVGVNRRWVVLIDRELSQYYNEKENKLDLYSFNENDLKRMKDILKTRYNQLSKVKKYINEVLDQYGDEFCSYLETKLGDTNNDTNQQVGSTLAKKIVDEIGERAPILPEPNKPSVQIQNPTVGPEKGRPGDEKSDNKAKGGRAYSQQH